MTSKTAGHEISDWKASQLPNLAGQTFVITGGNSGIGYEAARMLGEAGADIVIACRTVAKGEAAKSQLADHMPASVAIVELDLARMASVRAAADQIRSQYSAIDGLICNAGIMQTPETRTPDGFELQLGTNHLGHFLFAGLLIDRVEAAKGRVVAVSSIAHRFGRIDFDDLMQERKYNPTRAYGQSKLANLMFALELDKRLAEAGSAAVCMACHPGYSNTNLQSTGPKGGLNFLYKITNRLMAQDQSAGAVPTVLAAAGLEARRGGYYGPRGFGEMNGPVGNARISRAARNEADRQRLWEESEKLVDFKWDFSNQ